MVSLLNEEKEVASLDLVASTCSQALSPVLVKEVEKSGQECTA